MSERRTHGPIISLLPAATELIVALGAWERLAGVTHECDFPPEVRRLPVVTSTRLDAELGAATVDAAVREAVADGQPLFVLDEPGIRALRPTVLVTQGLCEVCTVSEAAVHRLAASRGGHRVDRTALRRRSQGPRHGAARRRNRRPGRVGGAFGSGPQRGRRVRTSGRGRLRSVRLRTGPGGRSRAPDAGAPRVGVGALAAAGGYGRQCVDLSPRSSSCRRSGSHGPSLQPHPLFSSRARTRSVDFARLGRRASCRPS